MKWFLAGLGLGTALGMLIAPKSGAETRDEIIDAAQNKLNDAREKIGPYVDQARERIEPLVDQGREQLSNLADRASELKDRVSNGGLLAILNEWTHDKLIAIDGIGPVLATKIIQNRPYASEDELFDAKKLPPSAIESLRRAA